jgi:hypothetical protein
MPYKKHKLFTFHEHMGLSRPLPFVCRVRAARLFQF